MLFVSGLQGWMMNLLILKSFGECQFLMPISSNCFWRCSKPAWRPSPFLQDFLYCLTRVFFLSFPPFNFLKGAIGPNKTPTQVSWSCGVCFWTPTFEKRVNIYRVIPFVRHWMKDAPIIRWGKIFCWGWYKGRWLLFF